MSESRYLLAGSPQCCQSCRKPFDGMCIRGDDNRYYCSEVCAQVELKTDVEQVDSRRVLSIAS